MDLDNWIDIAMVVGCTILGKKINDSFHEKDQKELLDTIEIERLKLELEHMKNKQEIENMKIELEYLRQMTS